jgi:hypothetical protein
MVVFSWRTEMRAILAVAFVILTFAIGLVMEPYVAMNYADQLNRARDTIGLCGGSTPCGEPYDLPSEPSPPPSAEPAPQ